MSNFYSNSVDYTFAFVLPNFCNKLTIIFLSCKGIIRTRSLSLSLYKVVADFAWIKY